MALAIPSISGADAADLLIDKYVKMEASAPAAIPRPPRLIVTLPPAWGNKYQILLYSEAAERKSSVVGVTTLSALDSLFWPGPILLHAHWFAGLLADAKDDVAALELVTQIAEGIERFKAKTGAKTLWTAHNTYPHGNAFPMASKALRRYIFSKFDAVHFMNPAHVDQLSTEYGVAPQRSLVIPHMTYDGSLQLSVNRAQARAHFGLPDEAYVFGFFGSVQRYKNIDQILDSFDAVAAATDRPVHAIIGGIASDEQYVRELIVRWGHHPKLTLLFRRILDHEVQYLHRASDIMVFPYRESLNSGAIMMAITCRTPFIAPTGMAAGLEAAGGLAYDLAEPDGLVRLMRDCVSGAATPRLDEAFIADFHPDKVSRAFFDAIETL